MGWSDKVAHPILRNAKAAPPRDSFNLHFVAISWQPFYILKLASWLMDVQLLPPMHLKACSPRRRSTFDVPAAFSRGRFRAHEYYPHFPDISSKEREVDVAVPQVVSSTKYKEYNRFGFDDDFFNRKHVFFRDCKVLIYPSIQRFPPRLGKTFRIPLWSTINTTESCSKL